MILFIPNLQDECIHTEGSKMQVKSLWHVKYYGHIHSPIDYNNSLSLSLSLWQLMGRHLISVHRLINKTTSIASTTIILLTRQAAWMVIRQTLPLTLLLMNQGRKNWLLSKWVLGIKSLQLHQSKKEKKLLRLLSKDEI